MPKPGPKKRNPTRLDRARDKADAKLLVFQGYSLAEAARIVGVELSAVKSWSAQDKWMEELARIKNLAKGEQPLVTTAERAAFDLAKTNRQARAALAQIANLTAMDTLEKITNKTKRIEIEDASDFASLAKASSLIAGDWQDAANNKFAVSVNLNQIANLPGQVVEIPEGAIVIED